MNTHLSTLAVASIAISLHLPAKADDLPVQIGDGRDTVLLKTGAGVNEEHHEGDQSLVGVNLSCDDQWKVREIVLGGDNRTAKRKFDSLNGVARGMNREQAVAKLGQPTAELPKPQTQLVDSYRLV